MANVAPAEKHRESTHETDLNLDRSPTGETTKGWVSPLLGSLVLATSLAVASVSVWLVPPYLTLMGVLLIDFLPKSWLQRFQALRRVNATNPGGLRRKETKPGSSREQAELVEPPSEPESETEPESDASAQDRTTETPVAGGSKPKRARGRSKKARQSAPEPAPATWVQVAPGKFVRVEGPSSEVPPSSSLDGSVELDLTKEGGLETISEPEGVPDSEAAQHLEEDTQEPEPNSADDNESLVSDRDAEAEIPTHPSADASTEDRDEAEDALPASDDETDPADDEAETFDESESDVESDEDESELWAESEAEEPSESEELTTLADPSADLSDGSLDVDLDSNPATEEEDDDHLDAEPEPGLEVAAEAEEWASDDDDTYAEQLESAVVGEDDSWEDFGSSSEDESDHIASESAHSSTPQADEFHSDAAVPEGSELDSESGDDAWEEEPARFESVSGSSVGDATGSESFDESNASVLATASFRLPVWKEAARGGSRHGWSRFDRVRPRSTRTHRRPRASGRSRRVRRQRIRAFPPRSPPARQSGS
jgi:hypothetical protein